MGTMVYRGLQSCLESQLVDPTLRLKLSSSSSKPQFEFPLKNADLGGLTFLQSLSTSSQFLKEPTEKKDSIYIPPNISKPSSSTLSEKSLKLCTENLGNETGTEVIENNIFSVNENSDQTREEQVRSLDHQVLGEKKAKCKHFPPPLTTIRGSELIRVKAHREDGRLIIEAVKEPERRSCFQAERSHGRLRLCFLESEDEDDEEIGEGGNREVGEGRDFGKEFEEMGVDCNNVINNGAEMGLISLSVHADVVGANS